MDLPGDQPSAPKLFADPAAVRAREARLHEPHIAELTQQLERIRSARGGGNSVPWIDPESGGRHAELLLLFEAPGARAVGAGPVRPTRPGSGFILDARLDHLCPHPKLLRDVCSAHLGK